MRDSGEWPSIESVSLLTIIFFFWGYIGWRHACSVSLPVVSPGESDGVISRPHSAKTQQEGIDPKKDHRDKEIVNLEGLCTKVTLSYRCMVRSVESLSVRAAQHHGIAIVVCVCVRLCVSVAMPPHATCVVNYCGR